MEPAGRCIAVVFALAVGLGAGAVHAAAPTSLPSDGSVAFVYSKGDSVTGCSQQDEAGVRDLLVGVVHRDPFVPAGKTAPFTLRVQVTRAVGAAVRAEFSLFDKDGGSLGTSSVEDATCDGAHLKLAASIALLLQPETGTLQKACPACPESGCDPACRTAVRIALRDEVTREVRAAELPRIRDEVQRELASRLPPAQAAQGVIGAGALFAFNYAADPAPGLWVSGEARWERWSLGVEARGLFPTRVFVLADESTIDVNALGGAVVPCLRWRWLAGCAVGELGAFWVAGPGTVGDPKGVLLSLGGRARLDVPIAFGLEARVFGDLTGQLLGMVARGVDSTGSGAAPYSFEVPRRVTASLGVGLVRSF